MSQTRARQLTDNMANKRPVEEILSGLMPSKSKDDYEKAWKQFILFTEKEGEKPTESDYIQYFDFLHNVKNYAASTLWKTYSMLNYMHQRFYNEKLQTLTAQLTQLVKTYNDDYQRKCAEVFTYEEINRFLNTDEINSEPYWVLRKALVVIALAGGLRCAEVTDLQFSDFKDRGDSYSFEIKRKKQVGEKKSTLFIVPSHHYQYIKAYTDGLRQTLGNEACQGRLFKGTPKNPMTQKSRYVNQSTGKNTIGHVGIDVATYLEVR